MSPQQRSVVDLIAQVRTRIKSRRVLFGVLVTVAVAALSLAFAAFAVEQFNRRPAVVAVMRALPLIAALAAAALFILRPLRAGIADIQIARLIEERCGLSDRLVTAVEFSGEAATGETRPGLSQASPAIVDRLVRDVGDRCTTLDVDAVVDPRQAVVYGAGAALILTAVLGMFFISSSPLSDGLSALYDPFGNSVSANSMFINVAPGTARVPRGSDQKIKATLNGFNADQAQVFVRKAGTDGWLAEAMEPAKRYDEFQHVIFNFQDTITYYVESNGIRSTEFTLEVADLPFVKQIDLVLNFPSYTRLPNKRIEDTGEVAALKGTVVEVHARLSGKASAARIVLNDGTKVEMAVAGDNLFAGQFPVNQDGTYRIEITSLDGEKYNGSSEHDITVLQDSPPTVTIDKPGRDMKVTSIQEVFAQARAEDDFGVGEVELFYSVNGAAEQRVKLQDLKSDSPRTLSGAHTFFLEEHGLQPGDFISYYAKARDNGANGGQESTSDIYFLEVRPFDRSFKQAQQQGGGEGEQDSNALTRRQREIIAATFRVQRELPGYSPEQRQENFSAVTLSQEKLKADADALAERIKRRMGNQLGANSEFSKLVEYITQASKEMEAATSELRGSKTKEALPPEQRSLQQLLRAEAIFRDIQVAQGGGQGSGESQENQELADLFELQLDKMKNQYETVQREQQAKKDQEQDDIARKLAELARRQQQQLEQQMRARQQQQGGGGGGSARQQQEMIDETRKMARELERLSRERRDPKAAETARQLQQAADDMQRAQASSSSSNSQESVSQSLRALEKLEQARRQLDSSRQSGGQQSAQQLRRRAEDALERQKDISKKVDELAKAGEAGKSGPESQEKKEQVAERKQALAEQMAGLEKDIDQAARGAGQGQQQAGDKLREAAGAIRRNKIPDRIRQNNQMIENGWLDQARERERIISGNIEEVVKNLQAAETGAGQKGGAEGLEQALNRARELADNLDSLRRKLEAENGRQQGEQQQGGQQAQDSGQQGQQQGEQKGQRQGQQGRQSQQGQQAQNGKPPGKNGQQGRQQGQQGQQGQEGNQQQGQQSGQQQGEGQQGEQGQQGGQQGRQGQKGQQGQRGQQQGQQGQQGQQSGGQQAGGQSRGGRSQSPSQQGSPSAQDSPLPSSAGGPPGGSRQLQSEIRERIAEAEELRKGLGSNKDLARELGKAIEQLRRFDPNIFADPSQLALLKSEVIDPLRQLELELARRLQAKLGNNGPGAIGDGDAPDRYRKMIEDYYRRLSVRAPGGQR